MSNFLRQNNTKRVVFTPTFIIVIFLVGVVSLLYIIFPTTFSQALHTITQPLWSAQNSLTAKISSSVKLLQSKRMLVEENMRLATHIEQQSTTVLNSGMLTEENQELKALLGRDRAEKTILAAVLSRPNVSLYDTIIIDIGNDYGIKKGDLAIASSIIAIGTISNVYKSTSVVTLFSAPGEETSVMIGPEQILTLARGRGGGNFTTLLPRTTDIVEGDNVVIPGINQKLFGVVESIIANSADAFQTILFKNPVNINEIRWVEIISPNNVNHIEQ